MGKTHNYKALDHLETGILILSKKDNLFELVYANHKSTLIFNSNFHRNKGDFFEELSNNAHFLPLFKHALSAFKESSTQTIERFNLDDTSNLLYTVFIKLISPEEILIEFHENSDNANAKHAKNIDHELQLEVATRKRLEKIIEEKELRYGSLVSSARDVMVICDEKGNILEWNRSAERVFGYSSKEMITKSFTDLVPVYHKESHQAAYDQIIAYGRKRTATKIFEATVVHKDGEHFPIEISVSTWKSGDRVFLSGVLRDISERYRIFEELKHSEQKFRTVINSSPDAILTCNSKGRISLVNDKFENLFGISKTKAHKRLIEDFIDFLTVKRLNSSKGGSQINEKDFIIKNPNGKETNVIISVNPFQDMEEKMFLITIRNVTLRIQVEKELNKAVVALTKSNKELEEFAYVSSHDLQEPLRTIINYTGLLNDNLKQKLTEDEIMYINYVNSAANRMSHLILDLLNYSRVGKKASLENVQLNAIIEKAEANIQAKLHKSSGKIVYKNLPEIKCIPHEMVRLFQNLFSNALKFKREGVDPLIEIEGKELDNEFKITVKDNGIGIDKEFKDRIFVIFQRLHNRRKYEGTGIGLATCRKIIDLHKGRIWVESNGFSESKFIFTVPK